VRPELRRPTSSVVMAFKGLGAFLEGLSALLTKGQRDLQDAQTMRDASVSLDWSQMT
jgi:hypothetical protein